MLITKFDSFPRPVDKISRRENQGLLDLQSVPMPFDDVSKATRDAFNSISFNKLIEE